MGKKVHFPGFTVVDPENLSPAEQRFAAQLLGGGGRRRGPKIFGMPWWLPLILVLASLWIGYRWLSDLVRSVAANQVPYTVAVSSCQPVGLATVRIASAQVYALSGTYQLQLAADVIAGRTVSWCDHYESLPKDMEWGLVTSSDTAGTVYFSYGYRFGIGEVAVRGPDGKPIGFCQFEIRPVCLTSACFMTLARKEFLTNRIDTYLNMSIID